MRQYCIHRTYETQVNKEQIREIIPSFVQNITNLEIQRTFRKVGISEGSLMLIAGVLCLLRLVFGSARCFYSVFNIFSHQNT